MSYVVLMTAYNEEKLLGRVLDSVLNQTIKPVAVVVVNDGSTDETGNIIKKYGVDSVTVEAPKYHLSSFNMVRALNVGYSRLRGLCFDYLLKIDADSEIPVDYVERLIHVMERNPRLGIVSGNIQGMKIWSHRCSDGAKLYRRACFDDIGGLSFIVHWDTHAILKAYMSGWVVRTVYSLEYNELRSHERDSWYDWYISGLTRHIHGFPLYHTFLVAVTRFRKPPFLGSLVMFLSHLVYSTRGIKEDEYRLYVREFSKMELKHRGCELLKN